MSADAMSPVPIPGPGRRPDDLGGRLSAADPGLGRLRLGVLGTVTAAAALGAEALLAWGTGALQLPVSSWRRAEPGAGRGGCPASPGPSAGDADRGRVRDADDSGRPHRPAPTGTRCLDNDVRHSIGEGWQVLDSSLAAIANALTKNTEGTYLRSTEYFDLAERLLEERPDAIAATRLVADFVLIDRALAQLAEIAGLDVQEVDPVNPTSARSVPTKASTRMGVVPTKER